MLRQNSDNDESEKVWREVEQQATATGSARASCRNDSSRRRSRVNMNQLKTMEDGDELLEVVDGEPGLWQYLSPDQQRLVRERNEQRLTTRRRQVSHCHFACVCVFVDKFT